MSKSESLKDMVLSFRVEELQLLLGFSGREKSGRKTDLQSRALGLISLRCTAVELKIKELYKKLCKARARRPGKQQPAPSKNIPSVDCADIESQQGRYGMYSASDYQSNSALHTPGNDVHPPNIYHCPGPSAPYGFPIHPNVRLKRLPFFIFLSELLKPSMLVPCGTRVWQESSFKFHLTHQQANDVSLARPSCKLDHDIQVQMRFCLIETSCEQEDCYPPGVTVKVNGKACPLPKPIPTNKMTVLPKLPPLPLNIMPLMHLSPEIANHVTVRWYSEHGKSYCVSVALVRKISSSELLQRLLQRGPRHPDFTKGLIKEKLQEDAEGEIATTSLCASLLCPIGKMRMSTPCRSATCCHLQCFDASLYLQMNEKKSSWICPVCDKPAIFDNLFIDGYFQQVLASEKLGESNEIQLHQDGSWTSLNVKKKPGDLLQPCIKSKPDDVVIISERVNKQPKQPKKAPAVVDLTLCDD